MKQQGMGRVRLGRFAAVTIPATLATAGLGFAVLQGMVGASLASASSFDVGGSNATGDSLELTANKVSAATSDSDKTATNKKDALVTLGNGKVTDLCLAADTDVPIVGTLGIVIKSTGQVSLGSGDTDLAADSLGATAATLGTTHIGNAESTLDHQSTLGDDNGGYAEGGFSLATDEATGAVSLTALQAKVYALTLSGLSLNNLSISPQLGTVEHSGTTAGQCF